MLVPAVATTVVTVTLEARPRHQNLRSHVVLRRQRRGILVDVFLDSCFVRLLLPLLAAQAKALDFFHNACAQLNEYRVGFSFQLLAAPWDWHDDIVNYP